MVLPNYTGGSIVNLMSSLGHALGKSSPYPELNQLPSQEIQQYKNVVLFVIDGLGYDYIQKHGKGTIFNQHLKLKMTTVFPSTTAAAITTFMSGLAPQQHALTGWFMHLKEIGAITVILRYMPRYGGHTIPIERINPKDIYTFSSFFDGIKVPSYVIQGESIIDSEYTKCAAGTANKIAHTSLSSLFHQLKKVTQKKGRKYIWAYWSDFDHLSHEHGKDSKKVYQHFQELNKRIASLVKRLKGTKTLLLITSDHGSVVTRPSERILLSKHPKLKETLVLPLSGDPRVAYCYVHPFKTKKFEQYVRKHLSHACSLHKSEDLIKKGYFGLFAPHPSLAERIGDYTLIMKKNYAIADGLANTKEYFDKGIHSGLSDEEMFVPLITIAC